MSTTEEQRSALHQTRQWVSTVVVGENFCPFARREVLNDRVRYQILTTDNLEQILANVLAECQWLDETPETETTLIVCLRGFDDFSDYLDLVYAGNQLLVDADYEGIYQLASFHPDYCFEGAPADDPANYTNRSPYPTLHLIREASIERVLQNIDDPDSIPERNVDHARKLGLETMKGMLQSCRDAKG